MPSGGRACATRYNERAYLQDELDAFSSVGLCRTQFAHTSFTRMKSSRTTDVRERAVLVGLGLKRAPHIPGRASDETARESLEELAELARSAGAVVVGSVLQMRDAIDPASVVGRGKLQEIRAEAQARQAPMIIFDRELTPGQQRTLRRTARQSVPLGTVALVGYTNAGKSTLFNALSRADVLVSSKMFATLDPTVRAVRLPSNRRVLFSDTVGFIRDLPKGLLAAFRATLEEVQQAALILHVTDISNPHHPEHDAEVEKVLV